ncbi:MAG TPA: dTMP kinase [Vicinamibacterales bacterium]
MLIAFEGLDQSGKQTQAERLQAHVQGSGRSAHLIGFPEYDTAIGKEIYEGLHGGRDYGPDVMQILYVANRYEKKPQIAGWLRGGAVVICDRYIASSVAYGEAHGLDSAWLTEIQRFLPRPDLTVLLDIAPDDAVRRKASDRDKYERDLALLSRVRRSYLRQADAEGWLRLDGARPKDVVAADVIAGAASWLGRP